MLGHIDIEIMESVFPASKIIKEIFIRLVIMTNEKVLMRNFGMLNDELVRSHKHICLEWRNFSLQGIILL